MPAPLSRGLALLLAVGCGMMAANLYYAQAQVGEISAALHMAPRVAGLVVTLTQIGYATGLFFIVSLADLVENRRLILLLVAGSALGLIGISLATTATAFLLLAFIVGVCSVGAQVMVPLAAHLAPPERQGQVVGNVMAGLLTGIMLARTAASGMAAIAGWRAIFVVSAIGMGVLWLLLARALPRRKPEPGLHYLALLRSSIGLLRRTPVIRRRTAYQAALFACFNLFWTAIPLVLGTRFGLGPLGMAIFALAGAGGALIAPVGGRLGDRGLVRAGTLTALAGGIVAFGMAGWAEAAGALVMLGGAAILLDAATQLNQVLGQRLLYALAPAARGRINAIYMTIMFLAGALGSTAASLSFATGGFRLTAGIGAAILAATLALFLTERKGSGD